MTWYGVVHSGVSINSTPASLRFSHLLHGMVWFGMVWFGEYGMFGQLSSPGDNNWFG